MTDIKDYNEDIQEMFVRFLVSDADLFARCQNIVEPQFFNRKFQPAIELLKSHTTAYNAIPTIEQLKAVGGISLEPIEHITPEHHNWFLNEFETFCRHKALEKAIIESADLLENKDLNGLRNRLEQQAQDGKVLIINYMVD
jgi:hypothetical protein